MDYRIQLAFVRDLLDAFHIASQIVQQPERCIPATLDRGLRAALFGVEQYNSILFNSMSEARDNTLYRFFDEYYCRYLFLRLPDGGGYFFVGPYLTEPVSEAQKSRIGHSLLLSDETRRFLTLYYEDLPLIGDENWLITIVRTLSDVLWGGPEQYRMEYIDDMIPDRSKPIRVNASTEQLQESGRTLEILEENYRHENQLMEAVSKGKMHLVADMAASVYNNGTEPRLTDSLRNRKNYLIILNTLLRKSAEMGGVHPLHIDKMSSDFARRIEKLPSIRQSLLLQETMIRDYCMLVRKYSLKKYSYYVGRAITLVHYDLTADLSLKSICAQLNVNPSYFSTLFRKEFGCTLTEYVNRQRIDRALLYLKNSNRMVQDIAAECGFSDPNYFIRLFKRQTGMTPNQYRQHRR